jgi:LmbE family N-acetylglucosaminyl deacetylase
MKKVLVFSAHSDDDVLGCGGSIAKFSDEGYEVIVVIFTKGDLSSPWLKKEYLLETREKESEKVGNLLGVSETIFLRYDDRNLGIQLRDKKALGKIKQIISENKPAKILVHSKYDPHKDHQAVSDLVIEALDVVDPKKKITTLVYEVWNLRNQVWPRVYIDITKYLDLKIRALKKFRSQRGYVYPLWIPVLIRNKISGIHAGCQYAERFYKIR